ncbi:MAG: type II toxin-antitoxin system VapC family toxin [Gammaproteobacteria bacterium]|nr:MAG: type II toxin-antitoxin system VapC family toxin [Gammaproteobacteria bacterium]
MILVDTSVWVDHLRAGDEELVRRLNSIQVLSHPFVVGEVACGNLRNRGEVLTLLGNLPQVTVATDAEVLFFIEQHRLMGRDVGYIDAHLLAAVSLASPARLWTRDKRLGEVAAELGLAQEG